MSFRFRILSRPPLPLVKAWFTLPEDLASAPITTTILDLKGNLLDQLPALAQAVPNQAIRSLVLSIDDFELLDGTNVRRVIKDGDLVTIQLVVRNPDHPSLSAPFDFNVPGLHLARAQVAKGALALRKRKRTLSTSSDSSSTSSSSSSTSSSSSSSSSESSESDDDSTSTSSSSSSDQSSSSSSSAPRAFSSKQVTPKVKSRVTTASSKLAVTPSVTRTLTTPSGTSGASSTRATSNPPVPPGQGKASTHSRNKRRRLLRLQKREQHPTPEGVPASETIPNPTTLSQKATSNHPDRLAPSAVVSGTLPGVEKKVRETNGDEDVAPNLQAPAIYSLKNKNKKRGFKEAMQNVAPRRVAFNDQGLPIGPNITSSHPPHDATSEDVTMLDYGRASGDEYSEASSPRIVMTTLLGDDSMDPLPSNTSSNQASVGSTEVPPHPLHPTATQRPSSVGKTAPPELIPPSRMKNLPLNIIVTSIDVEADLWNLPAREAPNADSVLTPLTSVKPRNVAPFTETDVRWDELDNIWKDLNPVSLEVLNPGVVLAWQDVGLDYTTFSPKVMIVLGRVKEVESSRLVRIEEIPRPSDGDEDELAGGEDAEAIPKMASEIPWERLSEYRIFHA